MSSQSVSSGTPEALQPYSSALQDFDLQRAFQSVFRSGTHQVNAAEICCDRHAFDPQRVALRHRSRSGEVLEWTFAELRTASARFAEVLASRGVVKGDRVGGLLGRTPELLITILATWRLGAV